MIKMVRRGDKIDLKKILLQQKLYNFSFWNSDPFLILSFKNKSLFPFVAPPLFTTKLLLTRI